jgi:hypothetical protein
LKKKVEPNDLLNLPEEETSALRYFAIAEKLRMELQMLLTNRTFGSCTDSISKTESEEGFRGLVRSHAADAYRDR